MRTLSSHDAGDAVAQPEVRGGRKASRTTGPLPESITGKRRWIGVSLTHISLSLISNGTWFQMKK
ncbi:hypothetical protein Hanom_Chr06g00493851 [Helianthus anomalus]